MFTAFLILVSSLSTALANNAPERSYVKLVSLLCSNSETAEKLFSS